LGEVKKGKAEVEERLFQIRSFVRVAMKSGEAFGPTSFCPAFRLLPSSDRSATSAAAMTKPSRGYPRPLSDLLSSTLSGVLKAQGFASAEILARWPQIAGSEIAAVSEPLKINWPRQIGEEPPQPATLVLRVEGPAALEIQHMSAVILERVNRFFGWQAIGRIALRQAPLRRKVPPRRPAAPDPVLIDRIADGIAIEDDDLRQAVARLGASIKGK
jgi:hypothetical protein